MYTQQARVHSRCKPLPSERTRGLLGRPMSIRGRLAAVMVMKTVIGNRKGASQQFNHLYQGNSIVSFGSGFNDIDNSMCGFKKAGISHGGLLFWSTSFLQSIYLILQYWSSFKRSTLPWQFLLSHSLDLMCC